MIKKGTILIPADNSGVLTINTFHLYGGFSRKVSHFGDYVKISIRLTKPENPLSKKSKRKALIIRVITNHSIIDGTYIRFNYNNAVILKKRLTTEGRELYGPIIRSFKKKKFLSSFSGIL